MILVAIIITVLLALNLIPSDLYNNWSLTDPFQQHSYQNVSEYDVVPMYRNVSSYHQPQRNQNVSINNSHSDNLDNTQQTNDDNIDKYIELLQTKKLIRSEQLSTSSTIKYSLNDAFIIKSNGRLVGYKLCKTPEGYGNGLSIYWGSRSLAFWMNFKWEISCKDYVNHLDKNSLMSSFLPSKTDKMSSSNNKNEIYYPEFDRTPNAHYVIHTTSNILLYYNPYYQKVMYSETKQAIHDYYVHNNKNENIENDTEKEMHSKSDISIHIRCGDVLQLMHKVKDWDYGFLTLNFYKYVMNITNWKSKITEDTTIYIISQLSHKATRRGEISSLEDCNYLINYIVDNGFNEVFKPGKVKVMYDTDVNDDYNRMLSSPFLICSPSTFCFNVAAANLNANYVIIPNRGAWFNFIHIDEEYKNKDKSQRDHDNDYIIAKNSKLIPPNQLIIDTDIMTNFHCNKIDYKSSGQRYNQRDYTEQLAEYLVTH